MTAALRGTALRVPHARVIAGAAGLVSAGALFLVASHVALDDVPLARALFWMAVVLAVAGFGFAALSDDATGGQLVGLCALLAIVLYLPKLGRVPHDFIFSDELQFVRSVDGLSEGKGLFPDNSINPLVVHYPGLGSIVAVLAKASGLSVFATANILMASVRVLMLCSLFALYQWLTGASRTAAIAVLVYAANPAFFFFDAQFAYESLGLPLAIATLTIAVAGRTRISLCLSLALVPLLVVTHHVSSFALALLCFAFGISCLTLDIDARDVARRLIAVGSLTAVLIVVWWGFVARDTWHYLAGDIGSNLRAVPKFFTGSTTGRTPFSGGVLRIPNYEVYASYAGMAVLGVCFVGGAVLAWRSDAARRGRYLTCIVIGGAFFLSLPLQLLQDATAAPITPRIWEVAFIGVAPLSALALGRIANQRLPLTAVLAAAAVVLMIETGVVLRSGENIRFPGPYVPSSGPRAVTPDTIAAARWLRRNYGKDRVIMGDFTLASVFGAYADSRLATYQNYGFRPWRVFFGSNLNAAGRYELDRSGTEFVVVDRRTSEAPPFSGFYFARPEPKIGRLPRAYLAKFDRDPAFARIYDNGNVVIYRYLNGRPDDH